VISGLADWRPQPLTGKEIAQIHSIAGVALQRLADALLQPITMLAAVVWLLNGSFVDIAIITVVASASLALGSIVMPYVLSLVEDVRIVILGANVVRAAAASLIVILGWRAASLDRSDFVSLLIISILFYEIGSAVNVTTNPRSTIANVDQPTSTRARQVAGALAGILGGLVAWRAFANADLSFPRSAGWLLALGGIASIAAVWFQITAPIRRDMLRHKPSLVSRDEVQALLETGNVRRFLFFRLLFGFADLADPFLIIYGIMQMGLNLSYIGAIIFVLALSQVAGGIVWTVFRRARGSRRSMQIAAMLRLAGITLAIGVPIITSSSAYAERFDSAAAGSWVFVLAFALLGLGQSTYLRNEQAYAMRVAGDESLYPAAIMLTNFTLLITAIAALIGAWIIDAYSLETALVTAAMISFIALLASGVLVGPRTLRRRVLSPTLRGPRKPVRARKRRRFGRRRPRS
jgi:hypothetical protein